MSGILQNTRNSKEPQRVCQSRSMVAQMQRGSIWMVGWASRRRPHNYHNLCFLKGLTLNKGVPNSALCCLLVSDWWTLGHPWLQMLANASACLTYSSPVVSIILSSCVWRDTWREITRNESVIRGKPCRHVASQASAT